MQNKFIHKVDYFVIAFQCRIILTILLLGHVCVCVWKGRYPGLLFCSEAARKAMQTFLILLAPMLELLPINWFRCNLTFLYSQCSLSTLLLFYHQRIKQDPCQLMQQKNTTEQALALYILRGFIVKTSTRIAEIPTTFTALVALCSITKSNFLLNHIKFVTDTVFFSVPEYSSRLW